jgi:hypothetical protein
MVIIAGLVALLLLRAGVLGQSPASAPPPGWQAYNDPLRLYTVNFPKGWVAQHNGPDTTGTEGVGGVSFELIAEDITISNPSEGSGTAKVEITAQSFAPGFPVPSNSRVLCQAPNQHVTTLNGMQAMEDLRGEQWFVWTTRTFFVIQLTIPGVEAPIVTGWPLPGSNYIPPTPSPIPATWVSTDEAEVQGILHSLHATHTQNCS